MPQTLDKNVTIKQLTRYGFQLEDGSYVSWSKKFQETDKAKVVPGASLDVELYVADSGTQYCNAIKGNVVMTPRPAVDTERAKKYTPSTPKAVVTSLTTSDTMSKGEWAAKDTRISRQGCIQAAVQAVAGSVAVELIFTEAEKLAKQMLAFVNEAK